MARVVTPLGSDTSRIKKRRLLIKPNVPYVSPGGDDVNQFALPFISELGAQNENGLAPHDFRKGESSNACC